MFGSNKNKDVAKTTSPSAPSSMSLNSLVHGTSVEGKLRSTSDIRVDGTIKGDLICEAKVIIGPSGIIEGNIRCQNAVIEGKFEGTLVVADLLNIRENAKVTGDVSYGKLIVQSGAVISGNYKVGGEPTNGASKSQHESKKQAAHSSDSKEISSKAGEFAKAN